MLLPLALIALVTGLWRFGANPVLSFWLAYILTRPLGANIGDWLATPAKEQGLGLGTFGTSLVFLGAILACVVYLSLSRADVVEEHDEASAPPTSEGRQRISLGVLALAAIATCGVLVWADHQPHQDALAAEEGAAPTCADDSAHVAPAKAFPAGDVRSSSRSRRTSSAGSAPATSPRQQRGRPTWRPRGTTPRTVWSPRTAAPGPTSTTRWTACSRRSGRPPRTRRPRRAPSRPSSGRSGEPRRTRAPRHRLGRGPRPGACPARGGGRLRPAGAGRGGGPGRGGPGGAAGLGGRRTRRRIDRRDHGRDRRPQGRRGPGPPGVAGRRARDPHPGVPVRPHLWGDRARAGTARRDRSPRVGRGRGGADRAAGGGGPGAARPALPQRRARRDAARRARRRRRGPGAGTPRQEVAGHRGLADEVVTDDPADAGRVHGAVPGVVGVDDHHRGLVAGEQAAGHGHEHVVVPEPAPAQAPRRAPPRCRPSHVPSSVVRGTPAPDGRAVAPPPTRAR
ncbi:hypothetical protein [Nocardioides convexus]|uniref:hypothetical protein n=1 Tax=Nocardioides convexus TaxID=2712224 RepID=UPI0024185682|nr:hypothetical protein [Nocardioides convexus]